jgi:hypothetical protein
MSFSDAWSYFPANGMENLYCLSFLLSSTDGLRLITPSGHSASHYLVCIAVERLLHGHYSENGVLSFLDKRSIVVWDVIIMSTPGGGCAYAESIPENTGLASYTVKHSDVINSSPEIGSKFMASANGPTCA